MTPGSVLSYLCQEPGLLPLLVRLFVFTGFCHILRLGSFVVCSSPIRITLECKQIVLFSSRESPLLYVRYFSNISRDISCDRVRPIKTFLQMNRDGSSFLCKNPFNFFGKFSNFLLFLSLMQSWADSMFSPSV